MTASIALIGNPNSGKTTVFNALTGARQKVGNWPGVTVEKKVGSYRHGGATIEIVDLPGTYSLDAADSLDERITQDYVANTGGKQTIVNVVDASSLRRGLFLSLQLLEQRLPVVIALNMMDIADQHGVHIDALALAEGLGCPVVPLIASREEGVGILRDAIATIANHPPKPLPAFADAEARYAFIDQLVARCQQQTAVARTTTDRIDSVVLQPVLAFPIFLLVMYLMFMFSINVGSAFIDLFDGIAAVLFVEGPRQLLAAMALPDWLVTFIADGVGGGVQLVATFIPVIGCLFLALSFLEDSGYIARVAFIVDRGMKRLGLPGKSFVPLIVGFGCNVPAVMATRALDKEPDRILTTIMAPYMSCGARLTVYALFAAAFFPSHGQNIVFALYLIGIAVAVLSALAVKRYLIAEPSSFFVLELPAYHLPTLKGVLLQTWQRLKGFILRAGKAIVAVVIVLNFLSSIGTDGSVGNENSEQSVLAAIGKTITPAFAPLGIQPENWPATVGIFTGIFAKEVVVGTLDALYTPSGGETDATLGEILTDAVASVPANLADLTGQLADPLGLDLGDTTDLAGQIEAQAVSVNTVGAMQTAFTGQLGAFAYLLFILLYMPCVATIGVIYKEIGGFWAVFSTLWSIVVAYAVSAGVYQIGQLGQDPVGASITLAAVFVAAVLAFAGLIYWGKRRRANLIPLVSVD